MKGFIVVQPAAEPVVEVFSVAGRERLLHCEPVVPASVGLALSSQEQRPPEPRAEVTGIGHRGIVRRTVLAGLINEYSQAA
jgi:hypothetical protein